MKSTIRDLGTGFKPLEINIQISTLRELETFCCLFNCTPEQFEKIITSGREGYEEIIKQFESSETNIFSDDLYFIWSELDDKLKTYKSLEENE